MLVLTGLKVTEEIINQDRVGLLDLMWYGKFNTIEEIANALQEELQTILQDTVNNIMRNMPYRVAFFRVIEKVLLS